MKSLTREEILAIDDIRIEEVEVPEWGGTVHVKGLTGKERDLFEISLVVERGKSRKVNMENFRAKIASLTVCNAKGERIFTEADARSLTTKSAAALQRILLVSKRLSGMNEEDVEELTEVLENDPFDGLPSD